MAKSRKAWINLCAHLKRHLRCSITEMLFDVAIAIFDALGYRDMIESTTMGLQVRSREEAIDDRLSNGPNRNLEKGLTINGHRRITLPGRWIPDRETEKSEPLVGPQQCRGHHLLLANAQPLNR